MALPEPGRPLEVEVAPPNAGESEAHLELVLAEELGVLHLSGNVKLTLPRTSWPIADLAAEAYLPAVFNYRRQGGSLEQVPDDEKSWDATFGTLATRGVEGLGRERWAEPWRGVDLMQEGPLRPFYPKGFVQHLTRPALFRRTR
jgi:hypothetical protein